ncbi:telomere repeats-binding bouquet formation protein 2 isoform X2 [Mugil cephalus]|uniref:telomere repeats-binding bouquet formation protein 2 isoform X2 n=1 Tax=Mugil cephalus TaxID=48193 RepID=UPI001FB63CA8|nr:telomere repeats-binding bouquet formation protein 2 isoform X2 [Mugil cephalus]
MIVSTMFLNKTAWFSSSVPQAYHNFWKTQGGTIAGWRSADYLFSADATCPDTQRIFESKDYICNKVTLFHSLFLSTCEKRQSVKSVVIGHYVLPPVSVQDEVRSVVGRLIWECEDAQSVAQSSCRSFSCLTEDEYNEEEEVSKSDCVHSDTDSSERHVSMDRLKKYSGDLSDVRPRCFRCSRCKAHCCLSHT